MADDDVRALRVRLFEDLQAPQGYGFVSDDFDDCSTYEQVVQRAEKVAYQMQVAANRARGIARICRRKSEME